MEMEKIHLEIRKFDKLLEPIANAEVDINDPNWQKNLREAQHPLDKAGIREPAERLTQRIIELFLASKSKERGQIRKLLADNENFAWAMAAPESSDLEVAFRNSLLLLVIDDTIDTRDVITRIESLVDKAQADGLRYRPIVKQIAKVAGTTDRYGLGSLRSVIKRYC